MKSLFVCIPCLCLGGSEVATLQMVQALNKDYDITVICYYEHDDTMVSRYEAAGVRVVLLNETRQGLAGLWRLLRRLVTLFKKDKPDVVHGVYFAPGMIPLLAARLAGVRHVFATVHAAGGRGYSWKAKLMFKISSLLVTHFFCVAENTERFWFRSVGGKRHSTIHNGIDLDAFSKAESCRRIDELTEDDYPIIGIVGRVVSLKGHDCLFRATQRLLNDFPKLKVLVVGEGPQKSEFQELANNLGINNHIIWAGRVEPEDLPCYYKCMHVLAMPSHWEGFGLTAAEAMAAGVPVAASEVPGLQEVVEDSGLLFPIDDDETLAQVLKTILTSQNQYASAGHKRVLEHFSLKQQQLKWHEVYSKLLN